MDTNIKLSGDSGVYSSPYEYSAKQEAIPINEEKGLPVTSTPSQPSSGGFLNLPVCGPLSVDYYKPYFTVSTDEVKERLLAAFYPLRKNFFEKIQKNTDLYGPFWIYTSLVFILAVTSQFSRVWGMDLSGKNANEVAKKMGEALKFVPMAVSLIYGYCTVVPVLLTVIMNVFGAGARFVPTVCMYGYAMTAFAPAFILSAIPHWFVHLVALSYGAVNTTLFMSSTIMSDLGKVPEQKKFMILGFIGAAQALLALIFWVSFY